MKHDEIENDGFYWIVGLPMFDKAIVDIYKSVGGWRIRGIIGRPDFDGAAPLLEHFSDYDFFKVEDLG